MNAMDRLESLDALRTLYAEPKERAVRKEIRFLDVHCRNFIALSPFAVLATTGRSGTMDASPRGGAPGFVRVFDDHTLLLPDAPGNNRLDTFTNIVETGRIGILFLVPGVDETLRINGRAALATDPALLALCADERRTPKVVVRITVQEAYLHCAKALLRSKLWSDEAKVERSVLPSAGRMISDQTGIVVPPETDEEMRRRYAPDL
jgi:PPOX class probable FMN-dependent enzyme